MAATYTSECSRKTKTMILPPMRGTRVIIDAAGTAVAASSKWPTFVKLEEELLLVCGSCIGHQF